MEETRRSSMARFNVQPVPLNQQSQAPNMSKQQRSSILDAKPGALSQPGLRPAVAPHLQLGGRQRVGQHVLLVCRQLRNQWVGVQVARRQLPRQVGMVLRMLCVLRVLRMWR